MGGGWQPLELFPSLELQLEKHHPGKGINSKVTVFCMARSLVFWTKAVRA